MRRAQIVATLSLVAFVFLGTLGLQSGSETLYFQGDFLATTYAGLADGVYSMRFAIYNSEVGGVRLWPTVAEYEEHPLVIVMGERFEVELGSEGHPITDAAHAASAPYVQVSVCQPAGFHCEGFEPLPLRLPLYAPAVMSLETPLPSEETEYEIVEVSSGGANDAWLLSGNGGTDPARNFLGTTDDAPLSLRVAGTTALRIEPNPSCPNLIGGYHLNRVAEYVAGGTIGGGGMLDGLNEVHSAFGTVGGGYSNIASGRISFVGGGASNIASGQHSVVAGGELNVAGAEGSAVGGGKDNYATHEFTFVGGGSSNEAFGPFSVVVGGDSNSISVSALAAVVAGGAFNEASGAWSAVAGGKANKADGMWSFVAGGQYNEASGEGALAAGTKAKAVHKGSFVWADSQEAEFWSMTENEFAVRAANGTRFVTSGGSGLVVTGPIESEYGGVVFPDGSVQSTAATGLPRGVIVMWSGRGSEIPAGWTLCDGTNGTPDLVDRFVLGAAATDSQDRTGGSTTHTHATEPHTHHVALMTGPSYSTREGLDPVTGARFCVDEMRNITYYAAVKDDALDCDDHRHEIPDPESATVAVLSANHLPPYYKLAFIMKL